MTTEPRSNSVLFNVMLVLIVLAVIVGIWVVAYSLPAWILGASSLSIITLTGIGLLIKGSSA